MVAVLRLFIPFVTFLLVCTPLLAGSPHSAYYSPDTDKVLWFIHASDTHIGTSGSTDSTNLSWLVTTARSVINPSFTVVSGDLTDSTNGNWLGIPDGPHQEEWNLYRSIVDPNVDESIYFDLPGNHDAYNDQNFEYYKANSVQGRATGRLQASWTRTGPWGKHHFLGVNTADNTGDPFSLVWPYGDKAGLDSSELSFIGGEMSANVDAELTMIFGHHPLVPTGNATDTYLFYGKDEFVGLMNNYGASLYGYGHTHASSQQFFNQNMTDGVFYFNVSSLGKDSPNQYTVTAIDCNGISSVTQPVGTWPVVLITTPMDTKLGGTVNPYAYMLPNAASNPIRALVFDPTGVTTVRYRVNGGTTWYPMAAVSGNPRLWQGVWDASALSGGDYIIEVQATSSSGVRSDTVTTHVTAPVVLPKVGVTTPLATGKYITTGSGKNKTTNFSQTTTFKRGETVVIQATVKNSLGNPVANATFTTAISGPLSVTMTSGPSNATGIAEAKWTTTAPNKRGQGGTPTGSYSADLTGVTAAGYNWDGLGISAQFTITP